MIDPKFQWAQMIEVTNACTRQCSNCTRFVGHHPKPFFVSLDGFSRAVKALRNFPTESPPTDRVPHKMVGMLGGEPLIHPQFAELTRIMMAEIPNREHRGLWTGVRWEKTKHAGLIRDAFGYINHNLHNTDCRHSPILVAIADVVKDEAERQKAIDNCWLQRMWSGTITPRGYFFCEVAASFDLLFNGPGGLPVEEGCWGRPLADFQKQIDFACHRCGIPLNLKGRRDRENVDDVSRTNLDGLVEIESSRVAEGRFVLRGEEGGGGEGMGMGMGGEIDGTTEEPWRYLQ